MEPITASAAATAAGVAAEKAAEISATAEISRQAAELGRAAIEGAAASRAEVSAKTVEAVNGLLDQEKYKKLAEFRELSRTNPEAVPAAYNDIHLKGQMGECVMEAKLSQVGEVRSQVPVQLEGAATGNKVDLQLAEAKSMVKQTEISIQNGEAVYGSNYDLVKGDSASFEVKNGGLPYLRQELASGELQQQIAAGLQLSDHSFVVINEDTARLLMQNPAQAAEVVRAVEEAGGKLIVGLPSQAKQMALFL
ncbi:hypothetical protein MO973_25245 [Paenibacillus sp. TRM 82003]|nr:hypothetical protein [Paenibacillus sp. TRM 82003]